MTGHTTLKDLQPVIFQNISAMLEELDEASNNKALASISLDQEGILNAVSQGKNTFRGGRFQQSRSNQRYNRSTQNPPHPPAKSSVHQTKSFTPQSGLKFCRICKLAGSEPSVFSNHEIGQCNRLTMRDLESLRNSLVINGMITERADSSLPEAPEYFFFSGWDDVEAAEHCDDDTLSQPQ